MNKVIFSKTSNKNFINLDLINQSEDELIEKKNFKVSIDSKKNRLVAFIKKDEKVEYEDIEDLTNNLIKINRFNLNINLDEWSKVLKGFTKFFVDRLLYLTHNVYTMKTEKDNILLEYNFHTTNTELYNELMYLNDKNEARNFAIDLQDMPPNILNPVKFSNLINERLSKYENLKINILNKTQIEKLNMGLILAVNAASTNDPCLVVVEYSGDPKSEEKIALVGKGITFDSGGYSLKNWKGMQMMKMDMSGAAIGCMTMELLAKYKPKINVIAIGCMTDNLIGGNGITEDAIVTSMNGKTVEIENTDCEGRLVLADGVTYAIRKGKATKIFTIATLTGNAQRALGIQFTAGFTNEQNWYNNFIKSSETSFERIWQMPLTRINKLNQLHTKVADIWNEAPNGNGGASNGAGFVREFVEEKPLIHLDIAGTAGGFQRHGTGIMLSTLADFLIKGE